jgi:hypothetical protein
MMCRLLFPSLVFIFFWLYFIFLSFCS